MAKSIEPPWPDNELVLRIRDLLDGSRGITEKRMFGGICFFAGGNMIGGVTGDEDLALRVGPDAYDECLAHPDARPMDFTRRPMRGFVYVSRAGLRTEEQLREWIDASR